MAVVVVCVLVFLRSAAAARHYAVGVNHPFVELDEVPWEDLAPGDTVQIHWREAPYRSKFVICRRGTPEAPIHIRGIAGPDGRRPVIDGREARTRAALNYWGEERSVVKIGGANRPADTTPAHIILEGLDVRGGRGPYHFSGRNGRTAYAGNAAAVMVEKGEHIVLRDLTLRDCGNGLFVSPAARRILVEGCRIHDNGVEDSIYEHNAYTQARGIVFQHNWFGPLREGCLGNNLKDRSAGLVVRYNWIEGGNRQLDLVDGGLYVDEAAYRSTFVYGNILIERGEGNRQVLHYGGDSNRPERYRKGTLYFYHNTVISKRPGRTTLMRLSTNDEHADIRNNIVYAVAGGTELEIMATSGRAVMRNNWLSRGWQPVFGFKQFTGSLLGGEHNLAGSAPGFVDVENDDFRLLPESPCVDEAAPLHAEIPRAHAVTRQWEGVGGWRERLARGQAHIGAFDPVEPPTSR